MASEAYGPRFESLTANTARAAAIGGTLAQVSGGKFVNGAVSASFAYVVGRAARLVFDDSDAAARVAALREVLTQSQ